MAARDPFTSHLMPHAAKIILIRHGEKNRNKDGEESGTGLSTAGKERAQCLVSRFADLGITNLFAFDNKPTTRYIYATVSTSITVCQIYRIPFHIYMSCTYATTPHSFADLHVIYVTFTCMPQYDTTGHCNAFTHNTVFQTPLCQMHHTFTCFVWHIFFTIAH